MMPMKNNKPPANAAVQPKIDLDKLKKELTNKIKSLDTKDKKQGALDAIGDILNNF